MSFPHSSYRPRPLAKTFALGCALLVAGGCTDTQPVAGPFERTGRLIALSGGDAGARGACVTCHGLEGEGDGNLAPRIAGLDAGYIAWQLELYAVGQRRHPQMANIARHLDPAARSRVAAYYAGLPLPEPAPTRSAARCPIAIERLIMEGDLERGIPACASCHGAAGDPAGQGNPSLAAQPAPYLAEQLRAWREGRRYGDPEGTMGHISRRLRPGELEPLADCIARPRDANNRPGRRAESH